MRIFIFVLIVLVIGFAAYVRLAPTDVAGVHVQSSPRAPGDYDSDGGFLSVRAVTATPEDVLNAVQKIGLATDRTKILAGSATEGKITFVTRSRVWGFPDYTTASIIPVGTVDNEKPLLMIDGRLRFGKRDLDVNKVRIETWLAALGPLTVPLDSATSVQ